MKTQKAAEFRLQMREELELKLEDKKRELFNLKFQLSTGQLEKTDQLPGVRKEIARLRTILREQELEAKAGKTEVEG
jgi:large subunit ribosomal protein L29